MTALSLHFDPQALRLRGNRPATGRVHVQLDRHPLPARDWDDFALLVASNFVQASVELLTGHAREARVPFYEGPYALVLRRSATDFSAEWLDRGTTPSRVHVRESALRDEATRMITLISSLHAARDERHAFAIVRETVRQRAALH